MISLKWMRVKMWGAGIEHPPMTFIVTHDVGGRWLASVDEHIPSRRARPLGDFSSREEAQQACQDLVDEKNP